MTDRDEALRNSEPATDQAPALPPPPGYPAVGPDSVPEPSRPGGMFRQPAGPAHRADGWAQSGQQGWETPTRAIPQIPQGQRPPTPPAWPAQPQQPQGAYPDPRQAPTSYAERIRPDQLVPARKVIPGHGWRLALYKSTFGLVNLGPSPEERRVAELEAMVRGPLRGRFKIGVMGKGGVGKTTVSACIGSLLAELRQDDRVVAIDADTAFGKLGSRVDPSAQGSFWELAGDQHLDTFADIRNRLGHNAAGLFVLAGEATPARRRVLDPPIYREAAARLDRHFSIVVVDCSSTMDSPVTQEVLRDLDALVVVSSPWVDGAAAAGQTLDWLAARGMNTLLQRTIVVLNDSDGHADKRTRSVLAQQFSGQGQLVIEVPFDGSLRPGGVIDGTAQMSRGARRKLVEVCAALSGFYPNQGERPRERR